MKTYIFGGIYLDKANEFQHFESHVFSKVLSAHSGKALNNANSQAPYFHFLQSQVVFLL